MIPTSPVRRILLAEDNPADVFLVREALRQGDVQCELRVIGDGEEVLLFLNAVDGGSEPPVDLLLLDLHLPRLDGESILTHLRASPCGSGVPVIVLTSSDSWPDKRKVERHAAVQFFRKPTSLVEFMELGPVVKSALPER